MNKKLKWIVLEGNIGAGKTTAAKALAEHLDGVLMLEHFEDNPYLEKFYRGEKISLLKLETHFLIERYYQIRHFFEEYSNELIISDYHFLKCLVFASVNLPQQDLRSFKTIFDYLLQNLPKPDLTIFLKMELADLQCQIELRGRGMEEGLSVDYLSQVQFAYQDELLRSNFDKKSLLVFDGKSLMGKTNEVIASSLLKQIKTFETE
jgi:deoxyadenosine/deoxycytidine kinase